MDDHEWLAERFEEHRAHLRAVAYRMLGSLAEADDAVQDAWLRLSRSDTSEVENLSGWLTTIVVGSGKRLFDGDGEQTPLKLVESETFSTGVRYLSYQPADACDYRGGRDDHTRRDA
jgi:DNA-directed RNA polymerase specialized sigma24 family protein